MSGSDDLQTKPALTVSAFGQQARPMVQTIKPLMGRFRYKTKSAAGLPQSKVLQSSCRED
jgi:hypothetical protein